MKKKILFLNLLLFSSLLFAQSSSVVLQTAANMPAFTNSTPLLDVPLSGGITQFAVAINNFFDIVKVLCIGFCFVMIVFNSLKLWLGTMEIKKMYVDTFYKALMCIAVIAIYTPATDTIMKLANYIGTYSCAGYKKLNTVYTTAYKNLLEQVNKGLSEITTTIATNAYQDKETGKKYITDSTIKDLESYGMTEQEALNWARQNGISVVHEEFEVTYGGKDGDREQVKSTGWYDENGNKITSKSWFFGISTTVNMKNKDKKMNKNVEAKKQLSLVTKLAGLLEVVSGEPLKPEKLDSPEAEQEVNDTKHALKNAFYSPYLKNINNKDTYFISPNQIIKTCTVMSDAVAFGNSYTIDETHGEVTEIEFNPKGIWSFKGLVSALTSLIYKFAMLLACIIIMAEYTITILEFYLIRAVATLLIPLMFLDATKSFASNLIKLFLSYFMKIMMTVLCCFFALGIFLDTLIITFNSLELSATLTLAMYLSSILIGLMLATKAPQLANAVISGSPAMGVGDIARMAGSASHALHSAGRTAHNIKQGAQTLGKGIQGVNKWGKSVATTLDAAGQAASRTRHELNNTSGYTGSKFNTAMAGFKAGAGVIGAHLKQSAGDAFHKAMFGENLANERLKDGSWQNSFVGFGVDETGNKGFTRQEMKDNAQKIGNKFSDAAVEKAKSKHMEGEEKDRLNNQRFPEAKNDR